jgi:hypothetical protein
MINGPRAAIMFSAPNFCEAAGFLDIAVSHSLKTNKDGAYELRTLLMKVRIGRNVVFVRLEASEIRNVVAAETGLL